MTAPLPTTNDVPFVDADAQINPDSDREIARLAALEWLSAVRPNADHVLQQVVDNVRAIFQTDLCMINLVTTDMQYFRAWSGDLPSDLAEARQDPRERSMCQYVVATEAPLVVHDFGASTRFANQYFCLNYDIHFYAGAPLITSDGHTIGSLCLLHSQPHAFNEHDLTILAAFARAAVGRLEVLGALAREQAASRAKDHLFDALKAASEQEALRTATQLQRTLDISSDILTTIGFDGTIQTINPACRAILGYEPHELIGCNYIDLIHPDDGWAAAGTVAQTVSNLQNRYVRKDGQIAWLEWNAQPVLDEQVMYCVARDITARKQIEAALHESQQRLRNVVANAPIVLFALDQHGTFTLAEGRGLQTLGPRADRVVGRSIFDVYRNDPIILGNVRRTLAGETVSAMLEVQPGVFFETQYTPLIDAHGKVSGVIGVAVDLSERVRAETALSLSETHHRAVVDHAFDAIVTMTADGLLHSFNRGAERIFGYTPADVIGQPLTILMAEHFRAAHTAGMQRYLASGVARVLGRTIEVSGRHHDGSEFPLELTITEIKQDDTVLFVGIMRNIAERKRFEAQLQHQAFHDPLTKLPNRSLFMERLTHALDRARRHQEISAVLFLDLDRFKVINDSLGHELGDRLLVTVVERLNGCVRAGDTIARFGGDEFTILLENIASVRDATEIADRIADAISAPFMLVGHEVVVTTSIGIALSTASYTNPDDLLRDADLAMYRAKHAGKARYEIFDPSMNAAAIERLQLEGDVRRAFERREFSVHYQPIIALASGTIVGLEALIRWQHPERGPIPPLKFIPLAEETGLIIPLGAWVLETACKQIQCWQQQFPAAQPLTISVNLSVKQFEHPDLVATIAQVIDRTGIAPAQIQLEITESMVMQHTEAKLVTLHDLKRLGVRLAIDDFGTGYSSLSYLKRFPVDTLKIDKAFVDGLGRKHEDTAIVQAIITLAHTLQLAVTAEGVESGEQAAQLHTLGCNLGQGYYFAKPLPAAEVEAHLAECEVTSDH